MHFILLALLAAGAADKPRPTWWCPQGPDHQGFWIQCQSTEQDCNDLVKNTDQNFAVEMKPCVEKKTAWCFSYRPRTGDAEYGRSETYCHDTLKHCQADERDVRSYGKYKELKSCAKQ